MSTGAAAACKGQLDVTGWGVFAGGLRRSDEAPVR